MAAESPRREPTARFDCGTAQTGAELAVLRGHTGVVSCVAFHPDGLALISGGRQPGDVKIWDLTRPAEYEVLSGGGAWALAFDEYDRLKRVTHTGRIETHDLQTGRTDEGPRIDLIQKWISPAHVAAFCGDGRLLAAVATDLRSVKVFDTTTGNEIACLRGSRACRAGWRSVKTAAASPPRQLPAMATPRAIRVWDALSGQVLADFRPAAIPGTDQLCGSVALSPDGSLVAFDDYPAADIDQTTDKVVARVRICDVTSSQERMAMFAGEGGIGCLAFGPAGSLIAASGADGRVMAWVTATGQRKCDDHLDLSPLDLAFSPDGRRLAAVNREVVAMWDMQTGKGILTLRRRPPAQRILPPTPH